MHRSTPRQRRRQRLLLPHLEEDGGIDIYETDLAESMGIWCFADEDERPFLEIVLCCEAPSGHRHGPGTGHGINDDMLTVPLWASTALQSAVLALGAFDLQKLKAHFVAECTIHVTCFPWICVCLSSSSES